MKYRGKYSLKKTLLNEASLDGKGTIFDERYPGRSVLFTTKMDDADAGDESSYFTLNSDQTTKIVIPKSAPGFNNTKLYDALVARDLGRYAAAFRKPHIQALRVDSGEPELITGAGYLFKDKDFGRGGARSAQAIGTQYEEDAAAYFMKALQANLGTRKLSGGTAGASDLGSDNEYYIGEDRENKEPGTKILKAEVKTSPGATYGQAQWRFEIDPKTKLPIRFKYQTGKKHFEKDEDGMNTEEASPIGTVIDKCNADILELLNQKSKLSALKKAMKAAAGTDKTWSENYKMASLGLKDEKTGAPIEVSGFLGGENGRNPVTQLIYDHIKSGFSKEIKEKVAKKIGNSGYAYYKAKGDQFIIVGSGYGIYSLDHKDTKELAAALKIPSFDKAGETDISLRTGGGRLINQPKVKFIKGDGGKGAPFPGTVEDLAAAVASGGDLGDIAIGFALFIQGSLEGLKAADITAKIDAAKKILGASTNDAVEDIVADTDISKEDVLGNPQAKGDEPGTQQNDSKQYNNSLSRLFEWAVK
jgi:hypothetical protein